MGIDRPSHCGSDGGKCDESAGLECNRLSEDMRAIGDWYMESKHRHQKLASERVSALHLDCHTAEPADRSRLICGRQSRIGSTLGSKS